MLHLRPNIESALPPRSFLTSVYSESDAADFGILTTPQHFTVATSGLEEDVILKIAAVIDWGTRSQVRTRRQPDCSP